MKQLINKSPWFPLMSITALVVFVAIRVPGFDEPIGPDQGIFAVIGNGIIQGQVPYKDLWDQKPPGIFLVYALAFDLFGRTWNSAIFLDLLSDLGTAMLLFAIGARYYGRKTGLIAAVVFAIYSNGIMLGMSAAGEPTWGTYWFTAQPEVFMGFFLSIAVYMVFTLDTASARSVYLRVFVCGLAVGIALMLKPTAITIVPVLALAILWQTAHTWRINGPFIRLLIVTGIGVFLALLPFVVYLVFNGAIGDAFEAIVIYGIGYSGIDYTGVLRKAARRFLNLWFEEGLLWTVALAGTLAMFREKQRFSSIFVLGWFVTSLLAIVIQRKFFGYHFIVLLPPLALLSAFAIKRAWNWLESKTSRDTFWRLTLATAGLLFIGTFGFQNYSYYANWLAYKVGWFSKDQHEAQFSAYPDHYYSYPADSMAATYTNMRTTPSDYVLVVGGQEPQVYLLADRPPASRFIYTWFMFYGDFGESGLNRKYREELISSMDHRKPKYVILIGHPSGYEAYPELYSRLTDSYRLDIVLPDDRFIYALVAEDPIAAYLDNN